MPLLVVDYKVHHASVGYRIVPVRSCGRGARPCKDYSRLYRCLASVEENVNVSETFLSRNHRHLLADFVGRHSGELYYS